MTLPFDHAHDFDLDIWIKYASSICCFIVIISTGNFFRFWLPAVMSFWDYTVDPIIFITCRLLHGETWGPHGSDEEI